MFAKLLTWWNSATIGTSFTLWRRGARLVGEDEQGNRFFEEASSPRPGAKPRRWVVYHGIADASRVTADWHGWLHYTFEEAPTVEPLKRRDWEKDHLPNMTGTPLAYHPKGSLSKPGAPETVGRDYEAWEPENA